MLVSLDFLLFSGSGDFYFKFISSIFHHFQTSSCHHVSIFEMCSLYLCVCFELCFLLISPLVAEINECIAVSLCGLVVRVLDWQLRGVGFNPHWGL